jgi:NADPH-dependent 2,4-dienoyl-CoA reductase/sulfur reductase-like enzyme
MPIYNRTIREIAAMTDPARERIAVIIGSGAMGLAAARRLSPACRLLVADNSGCG